MWAGTDMGVAVAPRQRTRYAPPFDVREHTLSELVERGGRTIPNDSASLFNKDGFRTIYTAGNVGLLERPGVSVIGSRKVSPDGIKRTKRIARELAEAGVVVVSGLAKGVDTAAHRGAIDAGGATMAVIGTPLTRVYPAENADLQEAIYTEHLLVSQFAPGARTYPSDFPKRNRVMATLSDASVIVEASDTSGTLHQAAECGRLGRWLFIMQSVIDNPSLTWPAKFLQNERVAPLRSVADIVDRLG